VLADVRAAAEGLAGTAQRAGRRVTGIGLVVPEIVSPRGVIVSSAVIPRWNELPVAATLAGLAPVRVEADVRASALAEAVLGAGRDYEYLVYVTVGTGISYTAVYQGRPVAGARGGALNIGTSVLAVDPGADQDGAHQDSAGQTGAGQADSAAPWWGPQAGEPRPAEIVLEDFASGRALTQRYAERGGAAGGVPELLAAAEGGDQAAGAVLREGARALGLGIALLVNVLDPEAVVVGGGLGSADTLYWTAAEGYARRYLHGFAADISLARGQLGPDAGVIGAGLIGLQHGAAVAAARSI
jgi:glucokinase